MRNSVVCALSLVLRTTSDDSRPETGPTARAGLEQNHVTRNQISAAILHLVIPLSISARATQAGFLFCFDLPQPRSPARAGRRDPRHLSVLDRVGRRPCQLPPPLTSQRRKPPLLRVAGTSPLRCRTGERKRTAGVDRVHRRARRTAPTSGCGQLATSGPQPRGGTAESLEPSFSCAQQKQERRRRGPRATSFTGRDGGIIGAQRN